MKKARPAKPTRPYIPLGVKIHVAIRQLLERDVNAFAHSRLEGESLSDMLERLLIQLGLDPARAQLDHNPALGRRLFHPRRKGADRWEPNANEPAFLEWVDKAPHLDKTAGRGGAQQRIGGDTREVAKTRRLEAEPEKWKAQTKPKRPNRKAQKKRTKMRPAAPNRQLAQKRKSRPIPSRPQPWPKGRKLGGRRP